MTPSQGVLGPGARALRHLAWLGLAAVAFVCILPVVIVVVGSFSEGNPFNDFHRSLGPWLRERGHFFVGLDVIGGWLTEVNVTSPTGILEANVLYDDAYEVKVLELLEEKIAQKIAEQSTVLLKNANAQLPLDASKIRSIAVIGPHADVGMISGGGSAQVDPPGGNAIMPPGKGQTHWQDKIWFPTSPLKAIRAKAPTAKVEFASGCVWFLVRIKVVIEMDPVDIVALQHIHDHAERVCLRGFITRIQPERLSVMANKFRVCFGNMAACHGRFSGGLPRPVWIKPGV